MAEHEERKATALQWVRDILTLVIIPILGWMLLSAIQTQREIVVLQYQVAAIAKDILEHTAAEKEYSIKSGEIHHNTGSFPCDRCHKHKK